MIRVANTFWAPHLCQKDYHLLNVSLFKPHHHSWEVDALLAPVLQIKKLKIEKADQWPRASKYDREKEFKTAVWLQNCHSEVDT